jgi:DNA-directed RNA polymerase beta subunit
MEGWALAAHGCMMSYFEKHSIDSDGRDYYRCRTCGGPAIYNDFMNIFLCQVCKEFADIAVISTSKSANLTLEELAGANIIIKLILEPRKFEIYKRDTDNETARVGMGGSDNVNIPSIPLISSVA